MAINFINQLERQSLSPGFPESYTWDRSLFLRNIFWNLIPGRMSPGQWNSQHKNVFLSWPQMLDLRGPFKMAYKRHLRNICSRKKGAWLYQLIVVPHWSRIVSWGTNCLPIPACSWAIAECIPRGHTSGNIKKSLGSKQALPAPNWSQPLWDICQNKEWNKARLLEFKVTKAKASANSF